MYYYGIMDTEAGSFVKLYKIIGPQTFMFFWFVFNCLKKSLKSLENHAFSFNPNASFAQNDSSNV